MANFERAANFLRPCVLGICVVLASLGGAAAAAPAISFHLQTAKQTYLVGEPVVAILMVRGSGHLLNEGFATLWRQDAHFRLLVNRGQGFVRFRAKRLRSDWEDASQKVEVEDGRIGEWVLGLDEETGDWIFSAPGSVQLMIEYQDADFGVLRSSPVALTVKAPDGDELAVYNALRGSTDRGAGVLQDLNEPYLAIQTETERALVQRYPRSVYLQGARLRDLQARLSQVTDQIDPSDRGSPPAPDRETRERLLRERRAQFLSQAEALVADLEGGQFAPDALVTLASVWAAAGNDAQAEALYARVVREFPNRAAAREAREEVADTTPPTIQVSASPSSLWPPNHKLAPVMVAVQVSDDADASPTVRLVSITCDDACDPALDIVGATYGTDDRQFDLRSERRGTSAAGRTYTITYSAEDAAGNKTAAETKVTIAHDQGQKK